ncbi:MAG: hypothetical protein H7196_04875 [candidate division SR1 bacterium]|nr:hypothetical protein [candidate division SR1 bacterium]
MLATIISERSIATFYNQKPDEMDEIRYKYLIEERSRSTDENYRDKLGTIIHSFYIKDIPVGEDADIPTCTTNDVKKQYTRFYRINFTKIWFFGIPYENKTVLCKV